MAVPKVLSGARALVQLIKNNSSGTAAQPRTIGIFMNFSYSQTYDVSPAFILGRYTAAEIQTVGMELVTWTGTGWRSLDHSVFVDGGEDLLQDLLNQETFTFQVIDRQTGRTIVRLDDCLVTGHSTGFNSKTLSDLTVNGVAIILSEDSVDQAEAAGAADLP